MFRTPPRGKDEDPEEPGPTEPPGYLPTDNPPTDNPPAQRLAAVTRKQHEIEELLAKVDYDRPALQENFTIYLQRVENLYSSCSDEHQQWLDNHTAGINAFRKKIQDILYPARPLSVKSKSSISRAPSVKLQIAQQKAKLKAKREMLQENAKLREEELTLRAKHDRELLEIQLRKERLETDENAKE